MAKVNKPKTNEEVLREFDSFINSLSIGAKIGRAIFEKIKKELEKPTNTKKK